MIKITFCSLSSRSTLISFILVSFWFILPYSVVIPPRSGVIWFYSRVSPPCSGIFRFILVYSTLFVSFRLTPVSFRLVLVYPGTILVHSVSFRCYSASFRHIPVYSVPFLCLVTPDFTLSNATLGTETERINLNST